MSKNRTYDGKGNNVDNPTWGMANSTYARLTPVTYTDGINTLPTHGGSNPRAISDAVCTINVDLPSRAKLTNLVWGFGQFIAHTLDADDFPPPSDTTLANIPVPPSSSLPPGVSPPAEIFFIRALFDKNTGTSTSNPRQQINFVSSYLDASTVYGSNKKRATALRRNDGSGKMKTSMSSKGDLLPFNTEGLPNVIEPSDAPASSFFVAGDLRVNTHAVLTTIHTLFVREHNRWCDQIIKDSPQIVNNDEEIFQLARKLTGAVIQAIFYNELLPLLIGQDTLSPYKGYDKTTSAQVTSEFATAINRLGHSSVSENILLNGQELDITKIFFNPQIVEKNGIEPFLEGLFSSTMREINTGVVPALREFLFNPPQQFPHMFFDLAAIDMQRGRDHGIGNYNDLRKAYGLEPLSDFGDISDDVAVIAGLANNYSTVDDVDAWVGAIASNHADNANVSEVIQLGMKKQFEAIRDGDRFWYKNDSALTQYINMLHSTTMADVIHRNTTLTIVPDNVFQMSKLR